MFSTEVDTAGMDFSRNLVNTAVNLKQESITDNQPSTCLSDHAAISVPNANESDVLEQREIEEFKDVLKELIYKEKENVMRLEEKILERLKKKALSRGWDRQTGIKVAPLRILS